MKSYSESFKKKVVQRLLLPGAPSANALGKELGIPQATLSRWVKKASTVASVSNEKERPGPRRPEDWTPKERLRAVLDADELSEERLGEFLRRQGLHEETLDEWRAAAFEALTPAAARQRAGSDKKRIEKLEKQLARSQRALAAANAVVVLQKKVHALLGDADDDTNKETDE